MSSRREYDAAGRLFRLTHHERNKVLARFIFKLDQRGNKTQAAEQLARPASILQTIGISDAAVNYYKGTWNTSSSYKVTTQFSSAMTITFTGNEAALTLGTGTDHGIFDIYIDGSLWESFDGYSASGIDRTINIYLDKRLDQTDSHVIDIRNRAEKNKNSSGYTLRFKQLVIVNTVYDQQTINYGYDALARLLTAAYAGLTPTRSYTYAYDRSGNRTQQIVNIGGTPTTTNYTYNAANQLISDGVHTLTYDNNGNLTNDGTSAHTWNRANRLSSLGGTSYLYDGEGHRVQQTVGATVTKYLLDLQPGLAVVLSETTGANTTRFVHGDMGVQAREDPTGNWFWSLQDALGSVRAEANNAVAVQGMRHFDPIGNAFGVQGNFSGMPYEFTGEPRDSIDLLYLRERYLNTQLGVFTGLDPFEGMADRPMSLNGYSWVEGNLPNAVDPSGMIYELPSLWDSCLGVGNFTFLLQPGGTPTPSPAPTATPCPTPTPTATPTPGTPTPGSPIVTSSPLPPIELQEKILKASVIVMFGKNSPTCTPSGLDSGSTCVADGASMGTLSTTGILTHDHYSDLAPGASSTLSGNLTGFQQYGWVAIRGHKNTWYIQSSTFSFSGSGIADLIARDVGIIEIRPTSGSGVNTSDIGSPVMSFQYDKPLNFGDRIYGAWIPGIGTFGNNRPEQQIWSAINWSVGRILANYPFNIGSDCRFRGHSFLNEWDIGFYGSGESGSGVFNQNGDFIGVTAAGSAFVEKRNSVTDRLITP